MSQNQIDLMNSVATPKRLDPDPHAWVQQVPFEDTSQIKTPTRLIDQIIGQEKAVQTALKAAEQKRNLMLIGDPGTGKSMLAKAMAEVLPKQKVPDIIAYHNNKNPNNPKIKSVPGGDGRKLVEKYETEARKKGLYWRIFEWTVALGLVAFGVWFSFLKTPPESPLTFFFVLLIAMMFLYFMGQKRPKSDLIVPKLLVENGPEEQTAPYFEGTGSQAGALLGDVRHDPFQSGGLETPPHLRVEAGAIHRAHTGVLFIDEINVLRLASQQALLTAMQDRLYAISGQSQSSSGSNVRTEPVPCDFILVAAGNQDALEAPDGFDKGMHPALRSRIRGYGYEVYVDNLMDDTHENRLKLLQFVAQEVVRDGRVPHLTREAAAEIIREAQRRAGRSGKLTLRLRELGGLVRTLGDFANTSGRSMVTLEDVMAAKEAATSMEQQMTNAEIHALQVAGTDFQNQGEAVGVANAVAVIGTGEVGEPAGIIVPVEAAIAPSDGHGSVVIDTELAAFRHHGLSKINGLLKAYKRGATNVEVHLDGTVVHPEADLAGINLAGAVAAISALDEAPVRMDTVFLATVSVGGDIRAIRHTLQRIEAAAAVGFRRAVVPSSLRDRMVVDRAILERIEVVYCDRFADVLDLAIAKPTSKRTRVRQKKAT